MLAIIRIKYTYEKFRSLFVNIIFQMNANVSYILKLTYVKKIIKKWLYFLIFQETFRRYVVYFEILYLHQRFDLLVIYTPYIRKYRESLLASGLT